MLNPSSSCAGSSNRSAFARFGKQAAAKAIRRLEHRLAHADGTAAAPEYRDVFICHAAEDRASVVQPIAAALAHAGISYWLDEAEIQWGDSVTQKVNDGLTRSRYVMAILSPAFLAKNWPQRELNAILNIEASTGTVRVLAILVGTPAEKQQALDRFPLLNDKLYLHWDGNPSAVMKALKTRLTAQVGAAPGTRAESALRDLRKLGGELQVRTEHFSSRVKCKEAARYLREIGLTMHRMAAEINKCNPPYRELGFLKTHAKVLPEALNSALTLMEAKVLVGKLAALARFDPTRPTTDVRRASVVAELAEVGGMFEALGAACRVHFTHG